MLVIVILLHNIDSHLMHILTRRGVRIAIILSSPLISKSAGPFLSLVRKGLSALR